MKLKIIIGKNYAQVFFVILAFFLMVMTSYVSVSAIVRHNLSESAQDVLVTVEANVKSHLREPEVTLVNSAFTIRDMISRGEGQESLLFYLVDLTDWILQSGENIAGFNGIYGYIRNDYIDGLRWEPPSDYVPQGRPWYKAAIEGGGVISATVPYVDAQTHSVIVSFSQELLGENGDSLGVVAIDVNVDKIAEYVTTLQLAEDGYGMLLNQQFEIFAHPDDAYSNMPLAELSEEYRGVVDTLSAGGQIQAKTITDTDGSSVILFFKQLENGWYVGLITPENNYYRDVRYTLFILLALGFILMLILSYVLVRLNTDKMQSEEKSKMKSSFLAHMSHEIRTPMNAIIGMANIAKNSISDSEKTLSSINRIITSSHHLLGILNDILDMSKIESGKMELAIEPFSLRGMYSEVAGILSQRCVDKKISFNTNENEIDDYNILGDKLRLSQILINLLGNAVKFTDEGGKIDFFIQTSDETDEKVTLCFSVSDSGIGMTDGQMEKLFIPFEQTDNAVATKYGGTGLGLSISQNLAKMMGGVIRVESEAYVGTRFYFELSFDKSNIQVQKSEDINEVPTALNLAGKRILLAEDVAINRIIVEELLAFTEVQIDEAEDGRQAVELFSGSPPGCYDLIFMDIQMPVLNGYEATKAIRLLKHEDAKKIPIVAMTANAYKEDIDEALASGMNAHLAKPIDIDAMMVVLAKYLS